MFAVLSSPCHVARLWGFSFFVDSCLMDIHPNKLGVIHEGAPCCRLRYERSKPTPNGRPFIMRFSLRIW